MYYGVYILMVFLFLVQTFFFSPCAEQDAERSRYRANGNDPDPLGSAGGVYFGSRSTASLTTAPAEDETENCCIVSFCEMPCNDRQGRRGNSLIFFFLHFFCTPLYNELI